MTSQRLQSCKLHNNKYLIALTEITDSEIFAFLSVLAFKLLSRKIFFINRKNKINLLAKWNISWVNYLKTINSLNTKFSGYC